MIKPQTNPKHFWMEKPQTDVITFNHEKTFRDLGYRIMWDNWQYTGNERDKTRFVLV